MALGLNLAGTSQALSTSLNTIFSEFRLLRDETGVCRNNATMYTLAPHTGTSKNILNYGRLQAFDLSDGVDMVQAQTLSDTNTAYTPAEVGVQVILPKSTLRRVADPELLRRTGRMMNNAYDLKEDADGCAQFPSFVPIVGGSTLVCSPGYLMAAAANLRIGATVAAPEPAPEPYVGILHPNQLAVLAGRLTPVSTTSAGGNSPALGIIGGINATIAPGRSDMSDNIIRHGPKAAGMIWDIPLFGDANIYVNATPDASGALFSKEAFIYVSEVEPIMEPDEKDASLRGVELNLWGSYVWGIYRASQYGVEALFDATLPTS